MQKSHRFAVLGGDRRMRYLADLLFADGCDVRCAALEKLPAGGVRQTTVQNALEESTVVVLPLPVSRDCGAQLFAPFAEKPVPLDAQLAEELSGKTVFGGMTETLPESPAWQALFMRDYFRREEVQIGGAILTAEGAVSLAVQNYPAALNGAKCLITGFGRIGKCLAPILRGMGAEVFGAARKPEDLAMMKVFGVRPLAYREIVRPFDVIFNTVPAPVLPAPVLRRQRPDTLVIELASAPGGVDREAAAALHVAVLDAPGLPGKYSPKTAAALIRDAVYNMLEE